MSYTSNLELWYALKRLFGLRLLRKLGRSAENWPTTNADVLDWTIVAADAAQDREDLFQVRGPIAISVGEERHYGVVYSSATTEDDAARVLAKSRLVTILAVCYNPADPDQMVAIPTREELPFSPKVM